VLHLLNHLILELSPIFLAIIYKYRDHKYLCSALLIFTIVLLIVAVILPPGPLAELDNPYPTVISGKYTEVHDFLLFERTFYIFEFSVGPFEKGSVYKSDYYKYEIGDQYNYIWSKQW